MLNVNNICVIGGSVSGLQFARSLKKLSSNSSNPKVTIYEEHDQIGQPVNCGEGWVGINGMGSPPESVIEMRADTNILRFLDKGYEVIKKVFLDTQKKVWTIDRQKYEEMLFEDCKSLDIDIRTGTRVTIKELQPHTDLIVDASGYPSQYRREYEGSVPIPAKAIGYEIEADVDEYRHSITMDFQPDFYGYYWIFPKSATKATVGIGWFSESEKLNNPKERLDNYIDTFIGNYEVLKQVGGIVGASLETPFYKRKQNTVLIGDAAGLVNPFTGEGMSSAVRSAKVLAESIMKGHVEEYANTLLDIIGVQLEEGEKLRKVWNYMGYQKLIDVLESVQNLTMEELFYKPERVRLELIKHPWLVAAIFATWLRVKASKNLINTFISNLET